MPEPQRQTSPPTETELRALSGMSPNSKEQATIGESLAIKGEVTGSESLCIDARVEGSIDLPGHRVTVGRDGVVSANISARERS